MSGLAATATADRSKPENKAEEVQDVKEDGVEARQEGDTAEVQDERAELDSAGQELNEAKADSARNN